MSQLPSLLNHVGQACHLLILKNSMCPILIARFNLKVIETRVIKLA